MSLALTKRVLRIITLEKEASDCDKLRQPKTAGWKRAKAQEIRDGFFASRGEYRKIRSTKQVFQDHYGRVRDRVVQSDFKTRNGKR